jgi:hypothetical protein
MAIDGINSEPADHHGRIVIAVTNLLADIRKIGKQSSELRSCDMKLTLLTTAVLGMELLQNRSHCISDTNTVEKGTTRLV